ncbi:YraN family protein [candidate division WOR-3 bacterium]|nr:YraN family protein [candidate division WOR-3 bacterium]
MNETGRRGEDIASSFLVKRGYRIVGRNFHYSKYGEIDIIAVHKKTLVFIEVKFRNSSKYGSAVESINSIKQKRIVKTARYFLSKKGILGKVDTRFDVIAIDMVDGKERIEHIKNAFKGEI